MEAFLLMRETDIKEQAAKTRYRRVAIIDTGNEASNRKDPRQRQGSFHKKQQSPVEIPKKENQGDQMVPIQPNLRVGFSPAKRNQGDQIVRSEGVEEAVGASP
jgi:hypothetical protein